MKSCLSWGTFTLLVSLINSNHGLPIVDPGLFVITGVGTCGEGKGYCLLGLDCTLDEDFVADPGGHCRGLNKAFTETAHFTCCSDSNRSLSHPHVDLTTQEPPKLDPSWIRRPHLNCKPSIVRFLYEEKPVCLGTLIDHFWALTSASCALSLSRKGVTDIQAELLNATVPTANVSAIVVHEDYQVNSIDNILFPEFKNLGLVYLRDEFDADEDTICFPSLPDEGQNFAGEQCTTPVIDFSLNETDPAGVPECGEEAEIVPIPDRSEFLAINCDYSWDKKFHMATSDIGKPLLCGNILAGVETASGIGKVVFSQVGDYIDWITSNMKPRFDSFNTFGSDTLSTLELGTTTTTEMPPTTTMTTFS